jgi:Glycosyltransferase family 28 N-terminal domain
MRVLLSTIGSRGDVQPVVALASQLRELGQEVNTEVTDSVDRVTGGSAQTLDEFFAAHRADLLGRLGHQCPGTILAARRSRDAHQRRRGHTGVPAGV